MAARLQRTWALLFVCAIVVEASTNVQYVQVKFQFVYNTLISCGSAALRCCRMKRQMQRQLRHESAAGSFRGATVHLISA